ncbi:MAG: hypothetical protein QW112_00755 [Candidatus Micrarchaeia archaeon]
MPKFHLSGRQGDDERKKQGKDKINRQNYTEYFCCYCCPVGPSPEKGRAYGHTKANTSRLPVLGNLKIYVVKLTAFPVAEFFIIRTFPTLSGLL